MTPSPLDQHNTPQACAPTETDPELPTDHELPAARNAAVRGGTVSDLWLYARFQLLSKPLVSLILLPLFSWLSGLLIAASGRGSVTSGDFFGFAFSWQGLSISILGAVLMTVLMVVDIVAVVLAELDRLQGRPLPTARHLLLRSIKQVPRFAHPATVVIFLFVGVVVPLVGVGPSVSQLSWVRIPAFVEDAIEHNLTYTIAYTVTLLLLSVLAFFMASTVPAMFVCDLNPWRAMRASFRFAATHWPRLLKMMLRALLLTVGIALVASMVLMALVFAAIVVLPESLYFARFDALLSVLAITSALSVLLAFAGPLQLRALTRLFFASVKDSLNSGPADVPSRDHALVRSEDRRARLPLALLSATGVCAIVVVAATGAAFFDEFFPSSNAKSVIAHRGGGDLDAENTVASLEAAISAGAHWSEIDVQRTKDGHYIINHDSTFSRLSEESRSAQSMSLEQIQQLSVKNAFHPGAPSRPVATLEQMFDIAKGRIGLFVELKGKSADVQMVDDVAQMIVERGMQQSAVILSLDLKLVSYAEKTYPELLTGYLYFFALGDVTTIPTDYLMMEEGLATTDTVDAIKNVGKTAIVWTVNDDATLMQFAASNVDGIITDRPVAALRAVSEQAVLTDVDRVLSNLRP